ncbi:MAG: polysaccharide deacetylase [Sphingomonas bacterium]|uniref:polysaccharide deacetylase family protein n=1 Tax=Sphingomonas bacterium TaxID=1895847 RepID=UPI00261C85A6|nr:polysaccharide deacetylase family protein [Sphingomonas bacterium]MDB5703952.1 polysaccharide deacetylase [Sphingomonas bacterium]
MKVILALAALALLTAPAAAKDAKPVIALTFDDLPAHSALPPGTTRVEIARKTIKAFADEKVEVYGFVNGYQIAKEPDAAAVLDMWRAAGLPLGNHGWRHLNLNQANVADYLADIDQTDALIAPRMAGRDWHWFRYPFLAEGDDPAKRAEVRKALADRHYRIAQVTMSFGDYMWNEPYARCVAMGDKAAIATLESSYLRAASETARATRADARALYGRDIPYVILMHIGALDAQMLPRLLKQYRDEGFDFTTLEKAEADPVFAADVNPLLPPALPRRQQLQEKGIAPQPVENLSQMLDSLCRTPSTVAVP